MRRYSTNLLCFPFADPCIRSLARPAAFHRAQSELVEIRQREEIHQRTVAQKQEELNKHKALVATLRQRIIVCLPLLYQRWGLPRLTVCVCVGA